MTNSVDNKVKSVSLKAIQTNGSKMVFNVPLRTKIASATRPDKIYVLSVNSFKDTLVCQCEAQENNIHCWHKTRFEKEILIVKEYMEYVVWLLSELGWAEVTGEKLYEYMRIAYVHYDADEELYERSVIQKYRRFVYNNLFRKLK